MKSNPLATRFVAPGKLPWYPLDGLTLEILQQRFVEQHHLRAAIVGLHGSGKSTLLEHLVPPLGAIVLRRSSYEGIAESAVHNPVALDHTRSAVDVPSSSAINDSTLTPPRSIVWLQLRGRVASRRLLIRSRHAWSRRHALLVIDGYEQLSRAARILAALLTRSSGAGLLLTSHRKTCLPTLIETRADICIAHSALEALLPADLPNRQRYLNPVRLQEMLQQHHGNLREVFMQLYDEAEKMNGG